MISVDRALVYIVTSLGAVGLIWCIAEYKRPLKQVIPAIIIGFGNCVTAAFLANRFITSDDVYYAAITTVSMVALTGAMFYISKDKWSKIVFELITQANAVIIAVYIGNGVAHFFDDNLYIDALFRALSFAALYLEYKFFLRQIFRDFANHYEDRYGWLILSVVSISFTVLYLSILYFPTLIYERADEKLFNIVMIISIVVYSFMYVGVVAVFQNTIEMQKIKDKMKESEVKMGYWQAQIDAQDTIVQNIRKVKHDLRHHDNILMEYLVHGDYDKAINYLKEHSAVIDKMNMRQYCSNYTVNCILSTYIQKAENDNIKVECIADIPKDVTIDELELTSLFANLIENAVEACNRIKDETREKFINIKVDRDGMALKILIENSCNKNVEFEGAFPVSQKEQKSGIGTKSIAEVVKAHDGMYDFKEEDGVFRARLYLVI